MLGLQKTRWDYIEDYEKKWYKVLGFDRDSKKNLFLIPVGLQKSFWDSTSIIEKHCLGLQGDSKKKHDSVLDYVRIL